ncbi:MAG TPA: copper resistance protein CopC [Candidatus Binatia bacterium]|nr:copper resistance protein CopC [Candidatus Binatia bacterium]
MRGARRGLLSSTAVVLALLAGPALPGAAGGVALAHAQLVASTPGAGTTVPESPTEIRLIFSEPLEAQVTSLDVVTEDGTIVLSRAGEIDPDDPYALVVDDPALPDGVYSLTWRTLSQTDGHTAEGFLTFGVGAGESALPATGGGMTHTESDPAAVAGRWLTYVGLLLALGVAVFHRVVVRDGPMPRPLVRLLAAGLAVSALATLAAAVAAALETGSAGEYLVATRNGGLQVARAAAAAVGAGALLVVPRRSAGGVAMATGLVGIGLLVAAGHAALPGTVAIIGQVVHVAAAAVWIGGLAGLLALLLRPSLLTAKPHPTFRTVLPRFSALALVSIGLVGLTGVHAAWVHTGALVDPGTDYGRALLLKSGLAIGAFALGGINFLDGGRMLGWVGGFRTRLGIEALAAAGVLVVTAVLATTAPTEEVAGVPIEPIPDAFGEVAPGMSMEVSPGRPGVNRVTVTTTDAMAGSVNLALALERLDDGTTTRVPLTLEAMAGMEGMDHGGLVMPATDGTADWIADALVLPAESSWDTNVLILSSEGTELSRQRFAFALSDGGVDDGRVRSLATPATGVAALLILGGALGLGLGLGGMALPRCEAVASRISLIGGGLVALVLGILVGAARLLA